MDYVNLALNSSEMHFRLLRFFVVFAAGVVLTRLTAFTVLKRIMDLKKYSAHRVSSLLQLFGFTVSLVIALEAGDFGNLLTVVGTIAAALTVAIGFGMREGVANYVSGVFIHMRNPYVRGDYVKIGEEVGRVKDIGMRATTLKEESGNEVMVPNSKVDSNPVRNYTKGSKNYVSIELSIENERAEKASKLLMKSASEADSVLEKPEPEVAYDSIGDEVSLKLNCTVKGDPANTKSEVRQSFTQKAVAEKLFESVEEDS